MRYDIWTIGCQMNKADSERVAVGLEALGLQPALHTDQADVIVVNTCVVRGSAEEKVLGKLAALRGLKRARPHAFVAVMGCLVPPDRQELAARFPHVDLFFTVGEADRLMDAVQRRLASAPQYTCSDEPRSPNGVRPGSDAEYTLQGETVGVHGGQPAVTKYVPIIYGCNNFCTYCIVPFRRGRERSRPPEEVLAEVEHWAARGVREVTLLGQNVDAYQGRSAGANDEEAVVDLAALLRRVHNVPGLLRIRFLTSHPRDMSDRLISTVAELPKVCPAINLPVQAGDNAVLAAMHRGYTVEEYRQLVGRIRAAIPGVALSTDLIVGFPGESEAQFQNSLNLLAELRFDMVHVAAYSPRPGTRAALMADDVSLEEKGRRLQAVESLQREIIAGINTGLLGADVEILVEGWHKGKWMGRTRTDKIVFFADDRQWLGEMVTVRVTKTGPWSLQGRLIGAAATAAA